MGILISSQCLLYSSNVFKMFCLPAYSTLSPSVDRKYQLRIVGVGVRADFAYPGLPLGGGQAVEKSAVQGGRRGWPGPRRVRSQPSELTACPSLPEQQLRLGCGLPASAQCPNPATAIARTPSLWCTTAYI